MAVIPLYTARPALAEQGAVQYPQGGGPVGAALQEAGHSLQRTAEHWQQQQDQLDAFKLRIALNETPGILDGALQNLQQNNMPADGSGFAKSFAGEIDPHTGAVLKPGGFDPIWQGQMAKVPELMRAKFAAMEPYYRQSYANKAATIEQGQRTDWARVEGTKAELELSKLIAQSDPHDPKAFEHFKEQGKEIWANAPGLDPAEKEKRAILWDDTAAAAYWQAKKANDAVAAKAALGSHDAETFTNIGGTQAPQQYFGPNVDVGRLPAGMRNNNPGNIKYGANSSKLFGGVVGPSKNTDQGDPQIVFSSPQAGMTAAASLVRRKFNGGKTTADELIAGNGGWTPGNHGAAANVARYMGVGPHDQLNLNDPQQLKGFLYGLTLQEHGPKAKLYDEITFDAAVKQATGQTPTPGFSTATPEGMNAGQGPTVAAAAGQAGTRTVPGSLGPPDPEFAGLTLEHRLQLIKEADAEINRRQVDARVNIEQVVQDAPAAVEVTGRYAGTIPSTSAFVAAYGPQEGTQKAAQFGAAMDVAHNVYDMQTMPNDAINGLVAGAKAAISSGPGAALQAKEYAALADAAERTQKARTEDPAAAMMQAFPSVRQAGQNAGAPGTPGWTAFLRTMAEAQKSVGILPENMALLRTDVAKQAVDRFKSPDVSEEQQIAAVGQIVFSTNDRDQQQALFRQLVKNGLPDFTEGAFEAGARNEPGAFKNLMLAALADPTKLGGNLSMKNNKPEDIKQEIQHQVFDPGQIGDLAMGLSLGNSSNYERVKRATELLTRSTQLRMVGGSTLYDAVAAAAKDLYGDRTPIKYDPSPEGGPGASVLFPVGTDTTQAEVESGLHAEFLKFNKVADERRMQGQALTAPVIGTSESRVIEVTTANRVNDIMHNGTYRNVNGGIGLLDAFTGMFLAGSDGKPFVVPLEEVLRLGKGAEPVAHPLAIETLTTEPSQTAIETPAPSTVMQTITRGAMQQAVPPPTPTVGY